MSEGSACAAPLAINRMVEGPSGYSGVTVSRIVRGAGLARKLLDYALRNRVWRRRCAGLARNLLDYAQRLSQRDGHATRRRSPSGNIGR